MLQAHIQHQLDSEKNIINNIVSAQIGNYCITHHQERKVTILWLYYASRQDLSMLSGRRIEGKKGDVARAHGPMTLNSERGLTWQCFKTVRDREGWRKVMSTGQISDLQQFGMTERRRKGGYQYSKYINNVFMLLLKYWVSVVPIKFLIPSSLILSDGHFLLLLLFFFFF